MKVISGTVAKWRHGFSVDVGDLVICHNAYILFSLKAV